MSLQHRVMAAGKARLTSHALGKHICNVSMTSKDIYDSTSLLRSLLGSSGDCIKILDLDGNLLFMTEGGMRIMEVNDFEEIRGCPWPDFWQNKEHEDAKAAINIAKAGGSTSFQGFATTMAGTPKWWDVQVSAILDSHGRPESILSVSRDITSTRQAVDAVTASEEKLRIALDAGRLGHWHLDLATGAITASRIYKEIFGRAADDELTFEDVRAALHPADLDRVLTVAESAVATGADYEVEYRILGHDGAIQWLLVRGQVIRDHSGSPVAWSGVSLDITTLKNTEHALVQSEAQFKIFAQAMPNQVWASDPSGLLDWFNDQVYAYSGLGYEDMKGHGWTRIVHPDDVAAAGAAWADALATGEPYQAQFRLKRVDDAWRWHLARALPISDESGAITRWVGTNTDIDDQKATEASLKRVQAQQRLLATELQHRMKNTMTMVGAIAHQTFRSASTKDQAKDALESRLSALSAAHDMLLETGWEGASLPLVVERAVALHRPTQESIRISGPDLELSSRQALSLALALHELATNAVKYGALSVPTGTISITWGFSDVEGEKYLRFEWREQGGPLVNPPKKQGFGSRLIERTLASDFGNSVVMSFEPSGLICRFDARISDLVEDQGVA